MATFEYKGRNRRGEAMTGVIEADNADRVAEQLFNTGITPTDIQETEGEETVSGADSFLSDFFKPGVSLDELIMFCRQMRTLMKAGIPILKGLMGLAESIENPTLIDVLVDVHRQLENGRELHIAFAQHPTVFTPLFIALVRVGESTGQLDQAFAILAQYLEAEKLTRKRIKTALRYPAIVISAIVIALIIINIWVIPVFADVFARFNAELPIMTRMLLATSNFMLAWWPWMLAGVVGGAVAFKFWIDTEDGRYIWDRQIMKFPLIGHILTKATLGRFAKSLSLIIQAGVPMVQGLTVVSGVVNNAFVADRVLSMRDGIEKGDSISRTAAATGLFTPLVLQMISVGEETGEIDKLLEETALFYEDEVAYALDNLSAAIEPIIVVVMGVMVTVLALGVFLPMWNLAGVVG